MLCPYYQGMRKPDEWSDASPRARTTHYHLEMKPMQVSKGGTDWRPEAEFFCLTGDEQIDKVIRYYYTGEPVLLAIAFYPCSQDDLGMVGLVRWESRFGGIMFHQDAINCGDLPYDDEADPIKAETSYDAIRAFAVRNFNAGADEVVVYDPE